VACNDPNYRDFCGRICRSVPACETARTSGEQSSPGPSSKNLDAGLVLQMFELGRLFVEKKMVTFSSRGMCMYPCIRPGDILHLQPRGAGRIEVGDIAVYRRSGRLFAHRAIEKGSRDGRDFIVTRPDTARSGDDGPSFDKDILGVVARIERNGSMLDTRRADYPFSRKLFLECILFFAGAGDNALNRLIRLHDGMQKYPWYRALTGGFFMASKIEFGMQTPVSSKPDSVFYRKLSFEDLKGYLRGESVLPRWMLTLKVNSRPAGQVSFFLKPDNCPFRGWWLYEAQLMTRYKGTYVEKKFVKGADGILRKLGINALAASVFNNADIERFLLMNMGFTEVSVGDERTIMHKMIV
jgi:hypothetical protein